MSLSSHEFLCHILDEIDYVVSQMEQTELDLFLENPTLKRAFVRSIEIIGEATKKLPAELTSKTAYSRNQMLYSIEILFP